MFKTIDLRRNVVDVKIIPGTPILYLPSEEAIVFSDLHLGYEEAVARGLNYDPRGGGFYYGMFVPRIQFREIVSTLNLTYNLVKPRRVIINGDLKHAFDRLLKQERDEVTRLIDYLINRGVEDLIIIRGNHDNFLPVVLKKYGLKLYDSYAIESKGAKILFTHGHIDMDISGFDLVIIGHEHVSLRCFSAIKFPVFLIVPTIYGNEIVITPAIGPYCSGTEASIYGEDFLSPLIKKYGSLSSARLITWFDLGTFSSVDEAGYDVDGGYAGLRVERFLVENREIAVLEFSNIDVAKYACGLY